MAAGGVVVYAVSADGYQAHETQLNDGGIWVTNSRDGFYGRLNKPIGQLDGAVFAQLDATLDIVQDGAAVVAVNTERRAHRPHRPRVRGHIRTTSRPGHSQQRGRGTARRRHPRHGRPGLRRAVGAAGGRGARYRPTVSALDTEAQPVGQGRQAGRDDGQPDRRGASPSLQTRTSSPGSRRAARPLEQRQHRGPRHRRRRAGPGDCGRRPLSSYSTPRPAPSRSSAAARRSCPAGSALQQAGPETDDVLVGTPDGLIAVNLEDGKLTTIADGVAGRPTAPVRLGACQYGAWSGGEGAVTSHPCDAEAAHTANLNAATSDLVFRVNRGEILLNDRATGAVWNIDSDEPTRMDNWDAFKAEGQGGQQGPGEREGGQGRPSAAEGEGRRPGCKAGKDHDPAPARQRHRP